MKFYAYIRTIGSPAEAVSTNLHSGDAKMSSYEKQMQATGQYYNQEMRKIEEGGSEILSSAVTGSNLHKKIHNPVTEGIDEG